MIIYDNHLLEGAIYIPCPKNKKKFNEPLPDTIILHYTAGRDAESSANYLAKDGIQASAHVVIGREGEIFQLVPFNTISWHAGRSNYKNRTGFNKYSIGIEIDNAGELDKDNKSWFGRKYYNEEVFVDENGKKWHKYTDIQLKIVKELCQLLIKKYNIKIILGHSDIASGRKKDPGAAFPLEEFKKLI